MKQNTDSDYNSMSNTYYVVVFEIGIRPIEGYS